MTRALPPAALAQQNWALFGDSHSRRIAAAAAQPGRILLASLVTVLPVAAQEVVELPGEDRRLEPNFEELHRVGSLLGDDWQQFGNVRRVGRARDQGSSNALTDSRSCGTADW